MSSFVMKKAAKKRATALLEPLLSDDDSSDDETVNSQNEKIEIAKQSPLEKLKTIGVYTILTAGVAVSALAMVVSPQTLVFVAGGLCCANVPYSAYKENALSKIPTLRSLNNALREDANRLQDEVDALSDEIDLLEPEADRAAEVEEELRDITDRQHYNVDRLVELVKENGEILEQMKDNLRRRIVQDIIHIVVSSDRDGDNTISRQEGKALSLKIRLQLESYGVEFDSEKFLKLIGMSPSVSSIVSLVKKLMPTGDDADEEDDDDMDDSVYDMFYIVEDEHGSISVTSEDIIGATMAFGGDTESVGSSNPRKRKSLVADAKSHGKKRGDRARNALAGSLLSNKDGGGGKNRRGSRK